MEPFTYVEALKAILLGKDEPMKAKDLIAQFAELENLDTRVPTIRQTIFKASKAMVLVKVKIKGFPSFYCLPQWFDGTILKEKYKQKIYAGKQIRIQKPTGSLGRIA